MEKLKMNRIIILVISSITALIGFIFLRNAMHWGRESINNYMRTKMGGSMDTDQYTILLEHYISTNKWIGIILLAVGLVFLFRNIEKLDFNKNREMHESDSTNGKFNI